MASRRPKKISRSLADLKLLVEGRRLPEKTPEKTKGSAPPAAEMPKGDAELFAEAMADVTPLTPDRYWRMPEKPRKRYRGQHDDPDVAALQRLIEDGDGFRVADTPEYMEAAGPGVDLAVMRRLHQGRYSVQGYVDLHGLTVAEAEETLSNFIHNALSSNKRMVLVIHGRGLTSPGQPVLKMMVYNWLTRGPLRRFILAFTSARSCDGGAGATYVLLRRRPWSKKKRSIGSVG